MWLCWPLFHNDYKETAASGQGCWPGTWNLCRRPSGENRILEHSTGNKGGKLPCSYCALISSVKFQLTGSRLSWTLGCIIQPPWSCSENRTHATQCDISSISGDRRMTQPGQGSLRQGEKCRLKGFHLNSRHLRKFSKGSGKGGSSMAWGGRWQASKKEGRPGGTQGLYWQQSQTQNCRKRVSGESQHLHWLQI